jgi:putative ABC transport system permease protein
MNRSPAPPRLALWLLRVSAAPRLRDTVAGDLLEEWAGRRPSTQAWFWMQSLALAVRFLRERASGALRGPARGWSAVTTSKGDGPMETFWNDARYGLRMLTKSPAFTLVAVLTLALGIGANTAIFSVVNAVILQPLPLPDSDRLFTGIGLDAQGRPQYFSYADFEDLRASANLIEAYSAFVPQSVNLTGREEPQRVRGGFVSDNFFQMLGVAPAIGRGFIPGQDDVEGAENVCVVQHETWQGLFGGDPNLLGKTLILNNEPFTVVGILPAGFRFPFDEVEVWMPHHTWPVYRSVAAQGGLTHRNTGLVGGGGRLKPGVTLQQAETEFKAILARLSKQYPEGGERSAALRPLKAEVIEGIARPALVLLGAVAFVLLIACANVANLMLGRAAARQRELATRAALGAGRRRLVSQLLTETGLLWLAGGVGGLLVGRWGLDALLAAAPDGLPGGILPQLDAPVFAFALAVTAFTGVLFGLIPALRFSSPNVTEALKEGGRTSESGHRTRLRAVLVVGQVALTLILLVGAGLMLRSFQRLLQVDVGFQPENLLTMEYRLPQNKYAEGPHQWETHNRIIEQVRRVPGVRAATLVRGLPFSGNGGTVNFELPGLPPSEERLRARSNAVDTEYFRAMGIPLLRGRTFTEQDRQGAPVVAVINRYMAERFWPGADPIGRKIRFPDSRPPLEAEIIGVVGDTKQYAQDDPEISYIYAAQAQNFHIFNTIAARTTGDPMQLANAVRAAVWSVDPEQPVWKIRSQQSLLDRSVGLPRFLAQLMGAYAALALLLAAVGIYGVMSYNVTQRTHEIGVRMALGAEPLEVLRIVLRRGLLLTGVGLAIGLAGALALGRVVQSLLFNVRASDPLTLAAVAALLAVVALLASYLPARRATRVDPLVALRYE